MILKEQLERAKRAVWRAHNGPVISALRVAWALDWLRHGNDVLRESKVRL